MSVSRFEPRIASLVEALEGGLGGGAGPQVRDALGLAADAEDRDVAHSLVQIIAACHVAAAGARDSSADDGFDTLQDFEAPSPAADSSFLGQLGLGEKGTGKVRLERVDHLPTVIAIARGGDLMQRRAAVLRVGELIEAKALKGDERKAAVEFIRAQHDISVEYELRWLRERHVWRARQTRAWRDEWARDVRELDVEIEAFWEGRRVDEPIAALPGATRARLMLHARDLPDRVIAHLAAVLEGADGVSSVAERADLLTALRFAGDARLIPTLVQLLLGDDPLLVRDAARALGVTEDPRVRPALAMALDTSLVDGDRAIIAGALGRQGDRGQVPYVVSLLERDDVDILVGLEALRTLGGPQHSEVVVPLLEHHEQSVVETAVGTLMRVGLGSAVAPLEQVARRARSAAVRAAVEDALDAIRARMELRGEEAIETDPLETRDIVPRDEQADPVRLRLRAWRHYWLGRLWLILGARERAVSRFEAAAMQRAAWSPPLIAMGMTFSRRGRHAQALNAFRRALQVDRRRLERNPLTMRAVALCFLRRAEEVDRDGRHDVARGLVGEALTLDLRYAPTAVRFELQRLAEALGRKRLTAA